MPVQRCNEARCTAGRKRAGDSRARALANCRRKAAASRLNLPPTSRPSTTSSQTASDCKFRVSAQAFAFHRLLKSATRSACGCASPARVTGDTKVVSTAACAPCQISKPFAKTSMRRPSVKGTSTFMSRQKTLVATRAPASRHTRAAALSNAAPRVPSTPGVGQAARWSPRASRSPPQRHIRARESELRSRGQGG